MSYASVILADGPVAYYRLDESSGFVAADEVGGNDATIDIDGDGGFVWGLPGAVVGPDTAIDLFGKPHIDVPDLGVTGAWSAEFWIKPDTLNGGGDTRLWISFASPPHNCALRLFSGNLEYIDDGATWRNLGAHGMTAGNWYQVVVTKTGTTVLGYVDGVAVGSPAVATAGCFLLDAPIEFANNFSGFGTDFDGGFDEISLWDRALTADEVAAHYGAGTTVPPDAPANPAATATGETTITVDWDDVANETGYRVERSLNGTTGWTDVSGPLAAGTVTFGDTGLTAASQYFYRVFAFNAGGDSDPSDVVSATTDAPPPSGDIFACLTAYDCLTADPFDCCCL